LVNAQLVILYWYGKMSLEEKLKDKRLFNLFLRLSKENPNSNGSLTETEVRVVEELKRMEMEEPKRVFELFYQMYTGIIAEKESKFPYLNRRQYELFKPRRTD